MFYREALRRCSALEDEVASAYAALAASPAVASERAAAWASAAAGERQKARLLHAAAEMSVALGDDGPFLVQVPLQLASLRKAVDRVRARLDEAPDEPSAIQLVESLDAAPRSELHSTLLEVAGVEIRRVLRLIESDTKSAKRGRGAVRKATSHDRTGKPAALPVHS
ncbi:MAG TPA: hypothetical protein VN634_08095 [Candidatus Limnocylindrales bacterium]|nr:hypothetical protein [Candidatus Limnocylindrales bacterium]